MNLGDNTGRFVRQTTFAPFGTASQEKLGRGRALVVGMGALGSQVAESLARAGVGFMRIVDGDLLQLDNLHRQTMYTEEDARKRIPKVEAATNHLAQINGGVLIDPFAGLATESNIDRLLEGIDVLVDGTDRFATRMMLNAAAVRNGVPLIHGGCLGCDGQVLVVLPGETACLQCLLPGEVPAETATCETAGVLMPIVTVVAGLQSMEAIKVLSGNRDAVNRQLTVISLWDNRIRQLGLDAISGNRNRNCPICQNAGSKRGRDRTSGLDAMSLCGRHAVQVTSEHWAGPSLEEISKHLPADLDPKLSRFVLKLTVLGLNVALFADGRAILDGTDDEEMAKKVYLSSFGRWVSHEGTAPL